MTRDRNPGLCGSSHFVCTAIRPPQIAIDSLDRRILHPALSRPGTSHTPTPREAPQSPPPTRAMDWGSFVDSSCGLLEGSCHSPAFRTARSPPRSSRGERQRQGTQSHATAGAADVHWPLVPSTHSSSSPGSCRLGLLPPSDEGVPYVVPAHRRNYQVVGKPRYMASEDRHIVPRLHREPGSNRHRVVHPLLTPRPCPTAATRPQSRHRPATSRFGSSVPRPPARHPYEHSRQPRVL